MLDMYDFQDDIWLCHSFKGQCFNFTAFRSDGGGVFDVVDRIYGHTLCGCSTVAACQFVGQGSSVELAALGLATGFCDYLSYWFMFLSIATSSMVATALAKQVRSYIEKGRLSHLVGLVLTIFTTDAVVTVTAHDHVTLDSVSFFVFFLGLALDGL